ncbi:MAG: hypothetical protein ACE5F1_09505 [Planctomycetota bacterium]
MDRRTGIILLLVVALLALPAVCLGGVLEHACGCSQDWCSHDACPNDPCDKLIRGDESDVFGLDLTAPVVLAFAPCVDLELATYERSRRRIEPRPPPRTLPYHASDVPLLI